MTFDCRRLCCLLLLLRLLLLLLGGSYFPRPRQGQRGLLLGRGRGTGSAHGAGIVVTKGYRIRSDRSAENLPRCEANAGRKSQATTTPTLGGAPARFSLVWVWCRGHRGGLVGASGLDGTEFRTSGDLELVGNEAAQSRGRGTWYPQQCVPPYTIYSVSRPTIFLIHSVQSQPGFLSARSLGITLAGT